MAAMMAVMMAALLAERWGVSLVAQKVEKWDAKKVEKKAGPSAVLLAGLLAA